MAYSKKEKFDENIKNIFNNFEEEIKNQININITNIQNDIDKMKEKFLDYYSSTGKEIETKANDIIRSFGINTTSLFDDLKNNFKEYTQFQKIISIYLFKIILMIILVVSMTI